MYQYDEPRALTIREKTQLQTSTDNFKFIGGKIIVETVLKSIANISNPSIDESDIRWTENIVNELKENIKKRKNPPEND